MKLKMFVLLASLFALAACGGGDAPAETAVAPADKAEAPKPAGPAALVTLNGQAMPAKGADAATAKVLIVEVSDFQCGYCKKAVGLMEELRAAYKDSLTVIYMHNALAMHKDARGAAIASVAAQKQGKFWEMHDKMFENMRALKPANLEAYATELGLDAAQFKKDSADAAVAKFVDKNQAISVAIGARGTPGFFVNGKAIKGFRPAPEFKKIIDEEIAAADAAGKAGAEWIAERTKTNNAKLHGFLYGGQEPPKVPAAKPRAPRKADKTVYKVTIDKKKDAIKGKIDAPITLAIFSEFQCPFCSRIKPTMAKISETYGDKVRFVFKHSPLPFHKDAIGASVAAICAGEQGKFWEMHDKMFSNQRALGLDKLPGYAGELGLNAKKFNKCLSGNYKTSEDGKTTWSGKHVDQIERDQELASKVMARGTPNTFVNGRKLTGAKPFEEFKTVIDEELKKAEALLTRGIKSGDLYDELVKNGKTFQPLEDEVNTFDLTNAAVLGKKNAKIQIVEFSDFQCPFCSRVGGPLKEVQKHYGDDAVVVFKNFPLSFHKEAMPAAQAALCAKDQGKFWEYHDQLFANMKALKDQKWGEYATAIGIDKDKLEKCVADKKYEAQVRAEMAEGRKAKVRGTPSIYINGRKFSSPSGYNKAAFTKVIDKHILKTGKKR
jgi:protein-disulfide isomerase